MHLQEDGQGCDHAEIDSANIVHGTRAGRGVNTAPRLEDEQSDVEDPDGAADVYEYMETLDLSDDELLGDQEREDAVEETATGQMLEGGDVQACVEQAQGEAQDGLVVQESAIAGGGSGLFLRDDIEPVAEGSGVGWFYGTRVTDAVAAALPDTQYCLAHPHLPEGHQLHIDSRCALNFANDKTFMRPRSERKCKQDIEVGGRPEDCELLAGGRARLQAIFCPGAERLQGGDELHFFYGNEYYDTPEASMEMGADEAAMIAEGGDFGALPSAGEEEPLPPLPPPPPDAEPSPAASPPSAPPAAAGQPEPDMSARARGAAADIDAAGGEPDPFADIAGWEALPVPLPEMHQIFLLQGGREPFVHFIRRARGDDDMYSFTVGECREPFQAQGNAIGASGRVAAGTCHKCPNGYRHKHYLNYDRASHTLTHHCDTCRPEELAPEAMAQKLLAPPSSDYFGRIAGTDAEGEPVEVNRSALQFLQGVAAGEQFAMDLVKKGGLKCAMADMTADLHPGAEVRYERDLTVGTPLKSNDMVQEQDVIGTYVTHKLNQRLAIVLDPMAVVEVFDEAGRRVNRVCERQDKSSLTGPLADKFKSTYHDFGIEGGVLVRCAKYNKAGTRVVKPAVRVDALGGTQPKLTTVDGEWVYQYNGYPNKTEFVGMNLFPYRVDKDTPPALVQQFKKMGFDEKKLNLFNGFEWTSERAEKEARVLYEASDMTVEDDGSRVQASFETWARTQVEPVTDHLQEIWCKNDEADYTWVVQWMATLVQRPWVKLGIILCLVSGQGAGKNVITDMLMELFGTGVVHKEKQYAFSTSKKKDVLTDGFCEHLRGRFLVGLNEAVFGKDVQAAQLLKELTTERHMMIDGKYKCKYMVDNWMNFIIMSNSAHACMNGPDDRRYKMLELDNVWANSNCRDEQKAKKQAAYMARLAFGGASKPGTMEIALFAHWLFNLVQIDDEYDVRRPTINKADLAQKERSMQTHETFFMECLKRGYIFREERTAYDADGVGSTEHLVFSFDGDVPIKIILEAFKAEAVGRNVREYTAALFTSKYLDEMFKRAVVTHTQTAGGASPKRRTRNYARLSKTFAIGGKEISMHSGETTVQFRGLDLCRSTFCGGIFNDALAEHPVRDDGWEQGNWA